MSTEKTPLAAGPSQNFGSTPAVPHYAAQDTHRFYSRRRRERQLQYIMFVTVLATFIMALIVTVSYTVNHPEILPSSTNFSSMDPVVSDLLQSTGRRPVLKQSGPATTNKLTEEEIKEAVAAGRAALAVRWEADAVTKPLPSPSPNSRHQTAVSTTPTANKIALAGIAEIAATRRIENSRSFMGKPSSFGTYIDGGWIPEVVCPRGRNIVCPSIPSRYRRFDGACNHPDNRGMAYTPFMRSLPPDYADGIAAPRVGKYGNSLPSARLVRQKVHPPSPSTNPSFTVMLAVFGQFLDHDITATADSRGRNGNSLSCCEPNIAGIKHPECFNVKVGPGDPVYDAGGSSCMEFIRSAPAAQCKLGPRQQLNQVTSFIDGSVIYGVDVEMSESLREFSGGRLRMQITPDNRELLPVSKNPNDGCNRQMESSRGRYCFASGDKRANENLHLTTMHLLWARQHNRLAEKLAEINPQWDDEQIFQEARRIVGAQLQHITYREFLPIVLGENEMKKRSMKPLSTGFRPKNDSDVDPSIANHFSAAAFRFAHTLLPGLIKMTNEEKGTSSWVQLHKLLFYPYSLYNKGGVERSIRSATSNYIQKMSTHVTSQLTDHLFEDPIGNKTTVGYGLDLVSLNIQRGRDHGLPGYVKWREYCGMRKPLKFADLKDDMDLESLEAISKLYENVDDVDLYTGALAEWPKGDGLVGPTFTCLIANQFERLQSGDKYWYEMADHPGSFTEDQLQELRKTSLARIICDTSVGITEVQAHVMRSVGPDNPIIPCEDIPEPSIAAWKNDKPLIALSVYPVPVEDWLRFKEEVNQTIADIISNIMAKTPPPGSLPMDWLAFQKDIDMTFTDLKNKFSSLHPKVVTNVNLTQNATADPNSFDWEGLKGQVNETVVDIMSFIYANKPPPGSLPADWLAFRRKINDSLMDFRKKFRIFDMTSMIQQTSPNIKQVDDNLMIDWAAIRNNVNETIMDVVSSISISRPLPGSTPAEVFAFEKKIRDTLSGIRNKFKGFHPKSVTAFEKLEGQDDDVLMINWAAIRNIVNITIVDVVSSISGVTPLPGSPRAELDAFEKNIKDTFAGLRNKYIGFNANSVPQIDELLKQVGDMLMVDDAAIKNYVNKTIMDIVSSVSESRPLPGRPSAEVIAFEEKMNDTLADIRNTFKGFHPKSVTAFEKLEKSGNRSTFDWAALKSELREILKELIESKEPPIDNIPPDWDWDAFQKDVNNTLDQLMDAFSTLNSASSKLKEDRNIPTHAQDNDADKKIEEIIDEIKASKPAVNSPEKDWIAYSQKLVKVFADLKNKNDNTKTNKKSDENMVNISATAVDLSMTLTDLLSIVKHRLPIDRPMTEWVAYKKEIKAVLTKIKSLFADIRTTELKNSELITENDSTFDWAGWKSQVNNTLNTLIAEVAITPPSDFRWPSFGRALNKTLIDLRTQLSVMQEHPPLIRLMQVITNDLDNFKDRMNSTLEDALDDIISNMPPAGDPSWINYNNYIKNKYAQMREDVMAIKTEWLDKIKMVTDVMMVTDSPRLSATGSASTFYVGNTMYQLQISILFVSTMILVR